MANLSDMIHGTKPKIAEFIPTDPIEMLKKLLSGEISDWPQVQQLGQLFQQTQMDWLTNLIPNLKSLFEGGADNVAQAQKNALALQKGELPPEDIAAIFRTSAGQSLKSGTLGSGMSGANALRNIGMGTLEGQFKGADLAGSAQSAAQRWMAMAQSTLLPTASYMYSPDWFTDFMAKQATEKRAVKQLRYNTAAAPDPAMAHRAAMLASLLGSFAGPGGGSMGQPISQNPALNWGSNVGQGVGAGVNFGGDKGSSAFLGANQGAGQVQGQQNPGFLTNFGTAYQTPGNAGTGLGGTLGNFFGNIFNSPGGG